MSDGNSIGGALADLAKETVKQVATTPLDIAKEAGQQIVGHNSEEEELKKRAEKMATFQRIKQIEAEMAQIRNIEEQKNQTQTKSITTPSHLEKFGQSKTKKIDEASRQAVGRAEQGRNFKG
ncbi:MAG: hypothetical protein Q7T54_02525 [Candidatus Levybacteria bacterium]|nr:hypothetical protein [Candidatus Levybacteria bacterium]